MLGYVFAIIGLLALIGFNMTSGRPNTATMFTETLGAKVVSQANVIRAELLACMVNYPTGNNGTGQRSALPAALTPMPVTVLTCPGKPEGNNALFGSSGTSPAPGPIKGLGAWHFVNDATSARLELTADMASHAGALTYAQGRLGDGAAVSSLTLTIVLQN